MDQITLTEEMQEAFLRQQNELRDKIEQTDIFAIGDVKRVAGVDLAYWKQGEDEYAVCCIVVIDFETHAVLEKQHVSGKIEVPYMPGFLAFRELPLILKTAELLETLPDIFIFVLLSPSPFIYLSLLLLPKPTAKKWQKKKI